MIKLMTQCRNIATVFAFAITQFSQAVVAQDALNSYPVLESEPGAFAEMQAGQSVLDFPERPVDLNGPEDLNVLTRGPLHEAFASAHQADPQPASLVFKAPPELIDEVPPEYKPDGNSVQWISGYWAWDDAQSDFIWISGIWRDVPPNRHWIPGYWDSEGDGYRWISGIWTEEKQINLGYLPEPPASLDRGPSTNAPGEDYFYIPGNWTHQDGNYRWLAGHWQPLIENWIWIPASYVWTPNGCVYQAGYWDYEIQNRGTCFAPVQFAQPVYLANNYSYRPEYAIDLNIDFMTHLFVRPSCGHYFYGDWYASNFNNVQYRPWVSYSSHFRSYDPLLAYYRCRRSSFDSRYNVVQYLARQHSFYVNNRDYRPRSTYRSQHKHTNNIKHLHASGSKGQRRPHEDFLRKSSYVRTYKDLRTHADRRGQTAGQTANIRNRGNQQVKPRKHHKVTENESRNTRRNVEQLAKVQRERKGQEILGKQNVARNPSSKKYLWNSSPAHQREQEQLRRTGERARQATADAKRRQQQLAQSNSRKPASADRTADRRTGDSNRQRSTQPERRTQPTRNAQPDQARLASQQQARQQRDRESARRSQLDQARRAQQESTRRAQEQVRRTQQDQARRAQQQDQARRSQQDRTRRAQQESALRAQEQVRRSQQDQARRVQQQDQARRTQQDRTRRAQQESTRRAQELVRRTQQDKSRRAQQRSQQDQARRAQQDQARRAQQQDQARRTQQAAAKRAKQDQDRRAQQRAQQERSRQQVAQRVKQQESQRDATQRAQQKSKRDAAKRAQANRQKSAQQNRTASAQQSKSNRTRKRSKSKK